MIDHQIIASHPLSVKICHLHVPLLKTRDGGTTTTKLQNIPIDSERIVAFGDRFNHL